MLRAVVERARREPVEQADERRQRVVRAVGIGGVALHAEAVSWAVSEPRRPIFIMSPMRPGRWARRRGNGPCARRCSAIQSRIATVPSVPSPSSSPVMVRTMLPAGGVAVTKSMAAATKAATPDFMSAAPRP